MQKWLLSIAAVVLVANVSFAQANAKATVEAAIKATGGKEKLAKYPAGKSSFSGEMSVMGMNVEVDGVVTAKPGKILTTMTLNVGGNKIELIQLADSKSAKVRLKVMGMTINQPLDDSQLEELKMSADMYELTQLLPLLDEKKYTLKAEEDAEVEKKKCEVVTATMLAYKREIKLYFDKETHLLTKVSYEGLLPNRQDGKKGQRATIYSEYKDIDGIKYPMKMVGTAENEQFLTAKVTDHKNLEKIEDKEFNIDD